MTFKRITTVLILMLLLTEIAEGKRGRPRNRGPLNRISMPTFNRDANSRVDYYTNPQGARIIDASHFDYEYVLGHKVMFICEAQGTPRPHVTWLKDGVEIFSHPYMQLHEWAIGEDKVKSKLEIDPATQMDAGIYECSANNKYFIDGRFFKADFSLDD